MVSEALELTPELHAQLRLLTLGLGRLDAMTERRHEASCVPELARELLQGLPRLRARRVGARGALVEPAALERVVDLGGDREVLLRLFVGLGEQLREAAPVLDERRTVLHTFGELGRAREQPGPAATYSDNVAKLLSALAGVPAAQRTARFRTVCVAAWPDGREVTAEGVLEGVIIEAARGVQGFGYDPVFVPAGDTRTLAELSEAEKNAISHRGRAARGLAGLLQE